MSARRSGRRVRHAETRGAGQLGANLVRFGRLLRRLGLPVTPEQTRLFASVLPVIGLDRRDDARAAGRAIFVRRMADRGVFDAAFDIFFRRTAVSGSPDPSLPRLRQRPEMAPEPLLSEPGDATEVTDAITAPHTTAASRAERLREADFGEMTAAEARDAAVMVSAMRPRLPTRPARTPRLGRHGRQLALRKMFRRSLATGGETVAWRWRRRTQRLRPLVLILDISGSMERYSRFLLRFAHAMTRLGAPVEVFVFGTRLTRITRELRRREPEEALRRVAQSVVDWGGGTRIGASLRELNRRWVRRTIRSSAIVFIVSDGWERDDPAVLAAEIAVLQRSCHRLLWLDPLASRPGFEPATAGLRAALPYVDALLPCASIALLEDIARRLGDLPSLARGRRAGHAAR